MAGNFGVWALKGGINHLWCVETGEGINHWWKDNYGVQTVKFFERKTLLF